MNCPYCSFSESKVIDSRPSDENSVIRRRRQCDSCGRRFTTYEKVETIPLMVIKKDNNREPFDRSKIESGIIRACHKRPVSTEAINDAVNLIESQIFTIEVKEIQSSLIGEMVMEQLNFLEVSLDGRRNVMIAD